MPYRKRIDDIAVEQITHDKWRLSVGDDEIELSEKDYAILYGLMSGGMAWTQQSGGWGIDYYTLGIPECRPLNREEDRHEEVRESRHSIASRLLGMDIRD